MTDWNDLCERLASYAQLDWDYDDPDGDFAPLYYATIDENLIEDVKYFVTEEDGGFWLAGELPDWVDRKVRYDTLEQAQAGARDHLVRFVLQCALEQIQVVPL